ncbi:hypothetical protein PMAYCL1PPCAC_16422, partial [Pristionchus mayeri]
RSLSFSLPLLMPRSPRLAMESRGVPDNASMTSLAGSVSGSSCQQCEETIANAQERERILKEELDDARALAARYNSELAEARKVVSRLEEQLQRQCDSREEPYENRKSSDKWRSIGCGNGEVVLTPRKNFE